MEEREPMIITIIMIIIIGHQALRRFIILITIRVICYQQVYNKVLLTINTCHKHMLTVV